MDSSNSNQAARLEDLREADLRPWRDLPVSRLLVEYLDRRRASLLEDVVSAAAMRPMSAEIPSKAGEVRAIDGLREALHPPAEITAETDPEFIDPATIMQPGKRTP